MSSVSHNATHKPRQVASKSSKKVLHDAIHMALNEQSEAVRSNTGTFNRNRYAATALIHDYDALKDRARAIKEEAIQRLPELVEQVTAAVKARGGHVFFAKDAAEANRYVKELFLRKGVASVVKSKSITSEEIHLNAALEPEGIEVVETDLAEFILQLADEQPSHIVAPAIHFSREKISALFKKHYPETTEALESGEDLTDFARKILRRKFLKADAGISGANFLVAETGSIVLVESEANIRMTTMAPALHVAVAGIEKIIPRFSDIPVFIELLGASGTGQPLTSYTNIITPPLPVPVLDFNGNHADEREFHLVLIDNGRLAMRDDPDLKEALYCIRCSACMNVCANFQTVGGHAFGGESYSGGIGGAWEAGTGSLEKAHFSELCTGCSRCVPNCPVRIDIPWLNVVLRHRLNQKNTDRRFTDIVFEGLLPSKGVDRKAPFQKQFFAHYAYTAKQASRTPGLSNALAGTSLFKKVLAKVAGFDSRRNLPEFPKETLVDAGRKLLGNLPTPAQPLAKVLVFADSFTNYGHPENGLALIRLLHALGCEVAISECVADGRAALSQGLIPTAKAQAGDVANELLPWIRKGYQVLVIEPSVFALFAADYHHLMDQDTFQELKASTFEAVHYLGKLIKDHSMDLLKYFETAGNQTAPIFFHGHCQQRSLGMAQPTIQVLQDLGFQVQTSTVECCGMAGSFGYKKGFYEISERLGEQLAEQVTASKTEYQASIFLASGTSCTEQIHDYAKVKPQHPLVFLASRLRNQVSSY
jgi:iron-sulfur cluster protein